MNELCDDYRELLQRAHDDVGDAAASLSLAEERERALREALEGLMNSACAYLEPGGIGRGHPAMARARAALAASPGEPEGQCGSVGPHGKQCQWAVGHEGRHYRDHGQLPGDSRHDISEWTDEAADQLDHGPGEPIEERAAIAAFGSGLDPEDDVLRLWEQLREWEPAVCDGWRQVARAVLGVVRNG